MIPQLACLQAAKKPLPGLGIEVAPGVAPVVGVPPVTAPPPPQTCPAVVAAGLAFPTTLVGVGKPGTLPIRRPAATPLVVARRPIPGLARPDGAVVGLPDRPPEGVAGTDVIPCVVGVPLARVKEARPRVGAPPAPSEGPGLVRPTIVVGPGAAETMVAAPVTSPGRASGDGLDVATPSANVASGGVPRVVGVRPSLVETALRPRPERPTRPRLVGVAPRPFLHITPRPSRQVGLRARAMPPVPPMFSVPSIRLVPTTFPVATTAIVLGLARATRPVVEVLETGRPGLLVVTPIVGRQVAGAAVLPIEEVDAGPAPTLAVRARVPLAVQVPTVDAALDAFPEVAPTAIRLGVAATEVLQAP